MKLASVTWNWHNVVMQCTIMTRSQCLTTSLYILLYTAYQIRNTCNSIRNYWLINNNNLTSEIKTFVCKRRRLFIVSQYSCIHLGICMIFYYFYFDLRSEQKRKTQYDGCNIIECISNVFIFFFPTKHLKLNNERNKAKLRYFGKM